MPPILAKCASLAKRSAPAKALGQAAFQNQLSDYAHVLRQESGAVTKAWKPGAPPHDWA
jgi:hypothetical protein